METTRGTVLTDLFELHFLELSKLPKVVDEENELEMWLRFIDIEEAEELEMLTNSEFAEIGRAASLVKLYNEDKKLKFLAEAREKAIRDKKTAIFSAKEEERENGIRSLAKYILEDTPNISQDKITVKLLKQYPENEQMIKGILVEHFN